MSLDTSESAGLGSEQLCSVCKVNTLRRGEKHQACFDCLDHGPKDFEGLRCSLCRSWKPAHFLAATLKYVDSSCAKADAIALAAAQADAECQEESGLSTAAQQSSSTSPAPGMSMEAFTQAVLSVVKGLGMGPTGPTLPGPSALLGVGVPAGSPSTGSASLPKGKRKAKTLDGSTSSSKKKKSSTKGKSVDRESEEESSVSQGPPTLSPAPSSPVRVKEILHCKKAKVSLAERGRDFGASRSIFDGAPARSEYLDSDREPSSWEAKSFSDSLDHSLGSSIAPSRRAIRGSSSVRFVGERGIDRAYDRTRSWGDRGAWADPVDLAPRSPAYFPVSRRRDAWEEQAGSQGSDDRSSRSGRTEQGADDRDSDFAEEEPDQAGDSDFRWALEAIATRMGLPIDRPEASRGKGRFAIAPERKPITLPVAPTMRATMERINRGVTAKKDVARSEASFPSWRASPAALETYRSMFDRGLQTALPGEDSHLRLLARKQGVVWSAYLKKARLLSWQNMVHQSMGQLSLADHLITLVRELVDESDASDGTRDGLQTALDILSTVVGGAERVTTTLGSHLDLTARESELRTLDLTSVDEAELRARPLFSGHTFAEVSRADVEAFRQNLRDEALARVAAGGAGSAKTQKKAKASSTGSAQTAQQASAPGQSFRTPLPPPPHGSGKRGGKGGGKSKGKKPYRK